MLVHSFAAAVVAFAALEDDETLLLPSIFAVYYDDGFYRSVKASQTDFQTYQSVT